MRRRNSASSVTSGVLVAVDAEEVEKALEALLGLLLSSPRKALLDVTHPARIVESLERTIIVVWAQACGAGKKK